jgi:hypothetical protein
VDKILTAAAIWGLRAQRAEKVHQELFISFIKGVNYKDKKKCLDNGLLHQDKKILIRPFPI